MRAVQMVGGDLSKHRSEILSQWGDDAARRAPRPGSTIGGWSSSSSGYPT
ncbi:hypothetical protein OG339_48985 (plasmid) [Streptosporangium sp. NBC_01495]|nr:hypothetical protein [Streptosporangium sp. NBC_01495]